jgi:hypothetical protein
MHTKRIKIITASIARKMIYETVALRERFPDLPNIDVIEHIDYVFNTSIPSGSVIEHAIIHAYDTENENAAMRFYFG